MISCHQMYDFPLKMHHKEFDGRLRPDSLGSSQHSQTTQLYLGVGSRRGEAKGVKGGTGKKGR